jgi:hypothetical protein
MSSILEALREIEDERRRARGDRKVSVTDAPAAIPGPSGLVYPLIGGLAMGALVFGLWISGIGRGEPGAASPPPTPTAPPVSAPAPAVASPGPPAAVDSPPAATPPLEPAVTDASPRRPAWLESAEAPQARVTSDAPGPAATAPAPAAAPAGRPGTGSVMVESIRYAAAPEQRTVTLRLDGRRVTLRQGERSGGIEVQLIMDDGAYLNRGAEVFFAAPAR